MQFDLVIKNDWRVDFNTLALNYPPLFHHLLIINFKTTIDFGNSKSLKTLTQAIIKYFCDVDWQISEGHLCPTVPSRLNYLQWIKENMEQPVLRVVEIGTGASLIYPILGCCLYGWEFVATQIDQESIDNCRKIIDRNPKLQQKIQLIQSNGKILKGVIDREKSYSVVMCNPPFFQKEQNTLAEMTAHEHHTELGQYGFFFELYRQSFSFPNINAFSCLIGRKKSFYSIHDMMQTEKQHDMIKFARLGLIVQGNCHRYIVAWKPNIQF